MLAAVARSDPAALYDALTELAVSRESDERELEHALAAFVRDLMGMLGRAGIALPPAIGGVFRALITLDGTVRMVDPGFDTATESRNIAREYAADRLSPTVARGSPKVVGGVTLLHLLAYIGLFTGAMLLSRVALEIGPFRRR